MNAIYFIIAICCLLTGHYFKILRWKQFIEIYERPRNRSLFNSLGWGYLINFIFPFRVGDFIRAIISGRKMKNGFGFALATVILDRMLDVVIVGLIFFALYSVGYQSNAIISSVHFYILFIGILLFLVLMFRFASKWLKKITKIISSLFNPQIQLSLLLFFWAIICTFTDIKKVNKRKLFINTLLMWGFYLLSYYLISLVFKYGLYLNYSFLDVFTGLFSNNNLDTATLSYKLLTNKELMIKVLFHIIPVLGLLIISKLPSKFRKLKTVAEHKNYINLLPHINQVDRLNFLETFFSDQRKDYITKFVEINQAVNVLQDFSAGSNATTLLCMDNENTFYRKYSFGIDGIKLYEQLLWLKCNEFKLPLPVIINEIHLEGLCSYDMEYRSSAVGFFNYIHSNPVDKSWNILYKVLTILDESLYTNQIRAKNEVISKYVESKVTNNIKKIKQGKEIKHLLEFDELIINGHTYKNLHKLEYLLTNENLISVFKNDSYCEIHGDLTIENIICDNDSASPREFYIIDPNGGNIHNSPFLDYAKLLQSLHGGYEFMTKNQQVTVKGNRIDFIFTKSLSYFEIYNHLLIYMKEKFGSQGLQSIYYHEIIHWLRLIPYKIEKNGKQSIIFYAGLIMIMNDIIDNKFE